MKFAVGYWPAVGRQPTVTEICKRFAEKIEEVYFPWAYAPSGRAPLGAALGQLDLEAQARLMEDLRCLRSTGVKLDLLLNASCYGGRGISVALASEVYAIAAYLTEQVGLEAVTTTSPMVAYVIKRQFPDIEVRASVNMRIGTVKAMQYVAHLFDGFYVQREFNRDLERIEELSTWAALEGKKLYMLANSGCLNFCSCQTFHDNLVAHEAEVAGMRNLEGFNPAICWSYLARRDNWPAILQGSWVRPEDIGRYSSYFGATKLATRMHANPAVVVEAYCAGSYRGNLLDLLEPGHGPLLAPYAIDNGRFPPDWFDAVTTCDKRCHKCDYCREVLDTVLVESVGLA
ncbi:MAG: hypothetical protein H5T86_01630 [Armatimonadetes bacterium]|nr:hypothetical protein [Armatimonadota bacterium]